MNGELHQYVIYNKTTKDHPGKFVVRKFIIGPGIVTPGPLMGLTDTLDEARDLVPLMADHCMPRYQEDDPVIVEVWM